MFVESVKPNGAAHKAGLIASDMILEVCNFYLIIEEGRSEFIICFCLLQVNGNPVRYSTHTDVVKWIKGTYIPQAGRGRILRR